MSRQPRTPPRPIDEIAELSRAAAQLLAVVPDHFGHVMIQAATHAAELSTVETRAAARELARLGLVIYTKHGPRRSRLRLTPAGLELRRLPRQSRVSA